MIENKKRKSKEKAANKLRKALHLGKPSYKSQPKEGENKSKECTGPNLKGK